MAYTRWGKNTCPSVSGTTLVYAGRAGGTGYGDKGGAANYLCMPDDPDISATDLEFKGTAMCMELSGGRTQENHSQLLATTMCPVLCAML